MESASQAVAEASEVVGELKQAAEQDLAAAEGAPADSSAAAAGEVAAEILAEAEAAEQALKDAEAQLESAQEALAAAQAAADAAKEGSPEQSAEARAEAQAAAETALAQASEAFDAASDAVAAASEAIGDAVAVAVSQMVAAAYQAAREAQQAQQAQQDQQAGGSEAAASGAPEQTQTGAQAQQAGGAPSAGGEQSQTGGQPGQQGSQMTQAGGAPGQQGEAASQAGGSQGQQGEAASQAGGMPGSDQNQADNSQGIPQSAVAILVIGPPGSSGQPSDLERSGERVGASSEHLAVAAVLLTVASERYGTMILILANPALAGSDPNSDTRQDGPRGGVILIVPGEFSDDERVTGLDRELDATLVVFDNELLQHRQALEASGAGGTVVAGQRGEEQTGGQIGSLPTASVMREDANPAVATTVTGGGRVPGNEPQRTGAGGEGEVPLQGAQAQVPLPDGCDDDVVASQIREAADSETDPELKQKLWQEYQNYKQSSCG